MNYADEKYYTDTYLCGKKAVITTAFSYYARKASQIIDRYTFGRVDSNNIPECVKMCCCEVAEHLYTNDTATDNGTKNNVTSERIGDLSVSYGGAEAQSKATAANVRSAIYLWLADTGLLYRGVQ